MAITTNRALLFLAGGCAAALAIAYASGALDPLFSKPPQPIVALPEPADTTQKDARVPAVETPADAAPETPAEAAAPAAEEPKVTAPSFDVVRVEGDGSIVIAGRTVPGSKVEILVGSKVIGSDTAGPEGDFAAVLGEPLKPGDYLRSSASFFHHIDKPTTKPGLALSVTRAMASKLPLSLNILNLSPCTM